MEATAASLTESFLPSDLALIERCENEVFKASNKLTTMLMNWNDRSRAVLIKRVRSVTVRVYVQNYKFSWFVRKHHQRTFVKMILGTNCKAGHDTHLSSLFGHRVHLFGVFWAKHCAENCREYALNERDKRRELSKNTVRLLNIEGGLKKELWVKAGRSFYKDFSVKLNLRRLTRLWRDLVLIKKLSILSSLQLLK